MSIQHSSATDRTGGIRLERAGTSKISWIASFKPKSSWSEDNSFTTAGVYLSEHRLCSFTLGSFGSPFLPWCGTALSNAAVKGHLLGVAALRLDYGNTLPLLPQ